MIIIMIIALYLTALAHGNCLVSDQNQLGVVPEGVQVGPGSIEWWSPRDPCVPLSATSWDDLI